MENKKTIGSLIEDEVRRQQIPIKDFADMIHCSRDNVYKIFKRNVLDVQRLGIICKVLNRNFFEDISKDLHLVDEDEEETMRKMAIAQFHDVVPKILRKMGKEPVIDFGRPLDYSEDIPLPDYMLTEYLITFTEGDFHRNKALGYYGNAIQFIRYESPDGIVVYKSVNIYGSQSVDIKLDYKSEEEWEKTLSFAFGVREGRYESFRK